MRKINVEIRFAGFSEKEIKTLKEEINSNAKKVYKNLLEKDLFSFIFILSVEMCEDWEGNKIKFIKVYSDDGGMTADQIRSIIYKIDPKIVVKEVSTGRVCGESMIG